MTKQEMRTSMVKGFAATASGAAGANLVDAGLSALGVNRNAIAIARVAASIAASYIVAKEIF